MKTLVVIRLLVLIGLLVALILSTHSNQRFCRVIRAQQQEIVSLQVINTNRVGLEDALREGIALRDQYQRLQVEAENNDLKFIALCSISQTLESCILYGEGQGPRPTLQIVWSNTAVHYNSNAWHKVDAAYNWEAKP